MLCPLVQTVSTVLNWRCASLSGFILSKTTDVINKLIFCYTDECLIVFSEICFTEAGGFLLFRENHTSFKPHNKLPT